MKYYQFFILFQVMIFYNVIFISFYRTIDFFKILNSKHQSMQNFLNKLSNYHHKIHKYLFIKLEINLNS